MGFSRIQQYWSGQYISRGSSQPRDWTQVSCIVRRSFTSWATREGHRQDLGLNLPCMTDRSWSGFEWLKAALLGGTGASRVSHCWTGGSRPHVGTRMYISCKKKKNHQWAPHFTIHPHQETEITCVFKHFNGQNKNVTDFSGHRMIRIQSRARNFLEYKPSVLWRQTGCDLIPAS